MNTVGLIFFVVGLVGDSIDLGSMRQRTATIGSVLALADFGPFLGTPRAG